MKLRILRNLGHGWPKHAEGETADVADDVAQRLIAAGLAEPIDGGNRRRPPRSETKPAPLEPGDEIPAELVPELIDGLTRKADAVALGKQFGLEFADDAKLADMKEHLLARVAAEADDGGEPETNPQPAD